MSTEVINPAQEPATLTAAAPVTPEMLVGLACAAASILVSLSLLPLWLNIGYIWATDPLRLIGILFPIISLIGVVSIWRRTRWTLNGSWWGVAAAVVAMLLARVTGFHVYQKLVPGLIVHPGPVLFLYACAIALLFGGRRLLIAALAPLCLLLFINPVPNEFNQNFDLPLQHLSANTARGFAHLIGLHPTGEQLKMMFTPSFGMQIVPGCNGVRGSVTFMYLALIFGYMRGLRGRRLATVTVSALLLGYAMNLIRLCTLVIYYRIGLNMPSIQDWGTQIDYVIGCTIFLFGTLSIGYVIRELEPAGGPPVALDPPEDLSAPERQHRLRTTVARMGCLVAIALVPIALESHLLATAFPLARTEQGVRRVLPQQVGSYHLESVSGEHINGGPVALVIADYSSPQYGKLTLGLYVEKARHTVVQSKAIDGVQPLSQSAFDTTSADLLPMHLGTSFYDDGTTRIFDAEGDCIESGCENPLPGLTHPAPAPGFFTAEPKRLPIVFRKQWLASDPAPIAQRQQEAQSQIADFARQLEVARLVRLTGSLP